MILAVDTETTGTDWWHGCRPFMVTACDDSGNLHWWEWAVNPTTRKPRILRRDISEITDLIRSAERLVFHNAKFDIRMLSSFLPEKDIKDIWDRIDDTLIMAHALRNDWSHGLKHLAETILGFPTEDQDVLQKFTNNARTIARKKFPHWRLAGSNDPHWPGIRSLPGVGWWVKDTWLPRALCTAGMVCTNEERKSSKTITHYLNHPEQYESCCRSYAKKDVERTILLKPAILEALKEEGLEEIYRERLKLLRITYDMETRGVTYNKNESTEVVKHHKRIVSKSTTVCYSIAPNTNFASPIQLGNLLYDEWELPVLERTKTGLPSTKESVLQKLADSYDVRGEPEDYLNSVLRIKRHTKSIDYLESYARWTLEDRDIERHIIHSQLNVTGTTFTRQSSNAPNLQNVGSGKGSDEHNLRIPFIPRPGNSFLCVDYSNLELRIWAYSCGNPDLIEAFESGESVHLIIAHQLHPHLMDFSPEEAKETAEYKKTKNGNFALIYGAGERTANETYGADGGYDRISVKFPEIRAFTRRLHKEVKRYGYIKTLAGYRLSVPTDEPHKAVSAFVQGTAGDFIGEAMRQCDRITDTMLLQIHDEIVFEDKTDHIEELCDSVCPVMTCVGSAYGIPTPVSAVIKYDCWGE